MAVRIKNKEKSPAKNGLPFSLLVTAGRMERKNRLRLPTLLLLYGKEVAVPNEDYLLDWEILEGTAESVISFFIRDIIRLSVTALLLSFLTFYTHFILTGQQILI